MNNKGYIELVVVILIIAVASVSYWYRQTQNQESETEPTPTLPIPIATSMQIPIISSRAPTPTDIISTNTPTPTPSKTEKETLQEKIIEQIELSMDEVTVFSTYDVAFDTIKISADGSWAKAVVFYKNKQTQETIPTEGDLILARKTSGEWQILIGLKHPAEWDQWVEDAPVEVVPVNSKEFWKNRY